MKLVITALLGITLLAGSAYAISERAQCLMNARDARDQAFRQARADFRTAQLGCDGECFHECRENVIACRVPALAAQESCLQAAEDTLNIAREACKQLIGCDPLAACARNGAYQQCLAPSRVVRVTAAQKCNRTAKRALKACDNSLRACNKECNRPVPTPEPTPSCETQGQCG